jgi:8-oxo-dGTP pyrophosphatase MutT (NUDIX family)
MPELPTAPDPHRKAPPPPMRLEFVQKAFIIDKGRLLMVRKSASDPRNPDLWEVPGGRMQPGEDTDSHVRREVWEETGVRITPGPPFQLWEWTMPDPDATPGDHESAPPVQMVAVARVCAALTTELNTGYRTASDHLDEARWVALDSLDRYDVIPDLKPVLDEFLRKCSHA